MQHHYTPASACVTNHDVPYARKAPIICALVKKGTDLSVFDHYGNTSLMLATRANDKPLTNLLLSLGANPDQTDEYNYDAVELSQHFGNTELAALLTEASPRRGGAPPQSRQDTFASLIDSPNASQESGPPPPQSPAAGATSQDMTSLEMMSQEITPERVSPETGVSPAGTMAPGIMGPSSQAPSQQQQALPQVTSPKVTPSE